jgi:hypothetical protein
VSQDAEKLSLPREGFSVCARLRRSGEVDIPSTSCDARKITELPDNQGRLASENVEARGLAMRGFAPFYALKWRFCARKWAFCEIFLPVTPLVSLAGITVRG